MAAARRLVLHWHRKGMRHLGKRNHSERDRSTRISQCAVRAEGFKGKFPPIDLPIRPPFPPMEAKSVSRIPDGSGQLFEPEWDGFRCLAFKSGKHVLLQSKAGQPLGRYFPELVKALADLTGNTFVLDGKL
jgi:ATP-dependent DNA ligase